jgi:hypothetical protein
MSSRAKRVASLYLKKSQTTDVNEVMSDEEIKESISEALERLYPSYIQQELKNLDTSSLFPALTRIVKHFGDSSEKAFYNDANQIVNRLLKSLRDSVFDQNSSFRKKILDDLKKQQIEDPDLIDDLIRAEFKKYTIDTERQTKIFSNKPIL